MENEATAVEMVNSSIEDRDRLELYFKDLYEREIVYKIDRSEIGFIQDGIENIVKGINRLVSFQCRANLKSAIGTFQSNFSNLTLVENTSKDEEASFETDILNIGSFYEKTKNAFPDEFDFVYVLGNFESSEITRSYLPYQNESEIKIHDFMKTALCSTECVPQNIKTFETRGLVYRISEQDSREIRFERYVERRDYSSRLQFVYKRSEETQKHIFVDITTGFRVEENIEDKNDDRCPLPAFMNEQFDNKSVLVVGGMIHFTEKEVHFMKKILSKQHIKVYRILKYLINGHGDYDEVRKMLDSTSWPTLISSYTIKLLIIYHHYECKSTDGVVMSSCISDLLEQLQSISSSTLLRNLTDVPNRPRIMRDAHRKNLLQSLRDSMIDIRQSTLPYAYEQYRLTPIATSYLLEENDSRSNSRCSGYCHVFITVLISIVLLALLSFAIFKAV